MMMVAGLNEKALISKSGLDNYRRMIMITIVMMMFITSLQMIKIYGEECCDLVYTKG